MAHESKIEVTMANEKESFPYRLAVVDGSGEILALTESDQPFNTKYDTNALFHSSMFPPVPLRTDRQGFYQVKGVNATGAQIIITVTVERVYDGHTTQRLPQLKYRGWVLDVVLEPDRLPLGGRKSGQPYWSVRAEGKLIGGFLSEEDETLDYVTDKARVILDAYVTEYIGPGTQGTQ